ncbi:MAG TPA: hypothetical protein VIY48_18155 [Candidatus Paceibacterota bacterium]
METNDHIFLLINGQLIDVTGSVILRDVPLYLGVVHLESGNVAPVAIVTAHTDLCLN